MCLQATWEPTWMLVTNCPLVCHQTSPCLSTKCALKPSCKMLSNSNWDNQAHLKHPCSFHSAVKPYTVACNSDDTRQWLMFIEVTILPCKTTQMAALATFPGRLSLHSLDCIHDLWTNLRSGRRPGITSTTSNRKVDSIMTYVDSVLVIMAMCPRIK